MAKLFIFLLILHVIGDFYLQFRAMCFGKYNDGLRGSSLYKHVLIIISVYVIFFALLGLVEYSPNGLLFRLMSGAAIGLFIGLLIGGPHLVIDALKAHIEKKKINNQEIHGGRYELWTFIADQLVHIAAIYWVSWIAYTLIPDYWQYPKFLESLGIRNLVFILMFLVCGKPANILTKRILIYRHIIKAEPNYSDEPNDKIDPQTGKLIGTIERSLIIFFMFIHQFAAIGFLITAKSILRFKDINKPKDNTQENGKGNPPEDGKDNTPKDGKDDTPKDGKDDTPEDGKDVTPEDGKDVTSEDGKDVTPEDGKDVTPEDGKDDTLKDGKDDSPHDGKGNPPKDNTINNSTETTNNLDNAEYILVGTFVSVSIAIICGYIAMVVNQSDFLLNLYKWLLQSSGLL